MGWVHWSGAAMALRKPLVALLIAVGLAVVGIGVLGVLGVTVLPRLYEEIVLDNQSHGRDCADLPSEQELRELLAREARTVAAIRAVAPDYVQIDIDRDARCRGKYSILVAYSSHAQREQIEKLVRGTELADAPINWRNV